MVYRVPRALFFSLWRMYQVLFQRNNAITIGIIKADSLTESGGLLRCIHLHVFFPKKQENRYKELFPNTHFYMGPYSSFFRFIGITFNNITFLFEIDHDDGTVRTDYDMR